MHTADAAPVDLFGAFYVSRVTRPLGRGELAGLVASFSTRNWRHGVTGALAFSGRHFAQLLEGPADRVSALMGTIAADPRHQDIQVLHSGTQPHRRFAHWGMRLIYSLDTDDALAQALHAPVSVDPVALFDRLFAVDDPEEVNPLAWPGSGFGAPVLGLADR